jgi:hypothetical protein
MVTTTVQELLDDLRWKGKTSNGRFRTVLEEAWHKLTEANEGHEALRHVFKC